MRRGEGAAAPRARRLRMRTLNLQSTMETRPPGGIERLVSLPPPKLPVFPPNSSVFFRTFSLLLHICPFHPVFREVFLFFSPHFPTFRLFFPISSTFPHYSPFAVMFPFPFHFTPQKWTKVLRNPK